MTDHYKYYCDEIARIIKKLGLPSPEDGQNLGESFMLIYNAIRYLRERIDQLEGDNKLLNMRLENTQKKLKLALKVRGMDE